MAQYLILIYENEAGYAEGGESVWAAAPRPTADSPSRSASSADRCSAATRCSPTVTATSIRGDVVTDGPFAETKEALGGYYLIEAPDLDVALRIGQACPAMFGGVEVRPVMVFDGD